MFESLAAYRVAGPNVIRESFDGEIVIVSLDNGCYYSLQGTGAEIWDLIENQATFDEMAGEMTRRYVIEVPDAAGPLRSFLGKLIEEGLIAEVPAPLRTESLSLPPAPPARAAFVPPSVAKFSDMQDLLLLDPIHDVDETGWPARAVDAGR